MPLELMLTAVMVGALGGVHCLGMCGPLTGAFTFQLAAEIQVRPARVAQMQLAYNLGRISTYVLLGTLAGLVGLVLVEAGELLAIQRWLLGLAGVWMLVLAAWLMGWSAWPARLEGWVRRWLPVMGDRWRQRLLPVRHVGQAYVFGVFWGALPCGLVYSTLLLALSAGSVVGGAAVMLAFGLGTLPNLLLMGASAFWLTRWQRNPWVARAAAAGMALLGGLTLMQVLGGQQWTGG